MFNTMKRYNTSDYRPLTTLVFLLASTIVIAQNGSEFERPSISYDYYDPIEIDGGSSWRGSAASDYDWRSPDDQQQGRIRYGYDPSYEEMQLRQKLQYNSNSSSSELDDDIQAPTQFRFNY